MNLNLPIEKRFVYAVLLMIIATVLGHFYRIGDLESSLIWPAIGVAFAFTMQGDKAIFKALFTGSFLGYSILLFDPNNFILLAPLIALLQASMLILTMIIARFSWHYLKIDENFSLENLAKIIIIITVTSLTAAFLHNIVYLIFSLRTLSVIFETFFIWMIGDVFGLLIFGLPYYLALRYDKDPFFIKWTIHEVIFYVIFIGFASVMLSGLVPYINFEQHRYFFIVFAIVMAFRYGYRTPFAFSTMTLGLFIVWPPVYNESITLTYVLDINIFLVILTTIVLIIKYFLDTLKIKNQELLIKSKRLDDLIDAAQNLLTLSGELSTFDASRLETHAKKIFHTVFTLFNKADYGACMLLTDSVRFIDTIGFDMHVLNNMSNVIENWLSDAEEPIILKDSEAFIKAELGEFYQVYQDKNPEIKESIYLSIRFTNTIVCTLSFDLDCNNPNTYTSDDLTYFKSMQKLLNGVFKTDQLISDYEQIKDELVATLLRTLELFDHDTMRHSMIVADIAKRLAEVANLEATVITNLYWAGIMHDIGKVSLPKALLKKPTLTITEYERFKKHPILGFEAIQGSEELKPIAHYVRHHHERFDGSGYPDGLKATQISLPMEILAVAEVIATMADHLPYSSQKSLQEIVIELKSLSQVHFSKELIRVAIKAINHGMIDSLYK